MLILGIALATVAAFAVSFAFYALAPAATGEPAAPDARPKPWQLVAELFRSLIVAGLVGALMTVAGWRGAGAGALLGLALAALPVVLLAGSVLWENVAVRAAALHAGDWLIKLVVIGAVVGLFR